MIRNLRITFTLLFVATTFLISTNAKAQKVTVNGVIYDLTNYDGNNKAILYSHDNDQIKDTVIIPKYIEKDGVSYVVSDSNYPVLRGAFMKVLIWEADCDIREWYCRKCPNLTTVIIKGQVDQIENEAFWNCFNLKKIVFNNGLSYIGTSAFRYCYALEEVTLPESVSDLGPYAFEDCHSLKKVNIKNKKLAERNLGMYFDKTPFIEAKSTQTKPNNAKRKPNQAVTNDPRFKVNKKSGTVVY